VALQVKALKAPLKARFAKAWLFRADYRKTDVFEISLESLENRDFANSALRRAMFANSTKREGRPLCVLCSNRKKPPSKSLSAKA
jgi:hypothetical protein